MPVSVFGPLAECHWPIGQWGIGMLKNLPLAKKVGSGFFNHWPDRLLGIPCATGHKNEMIVLASGRIAYWKFPAPLAQKNAMSF